MSEFAAVTEDQALKDLVAARIQTGGRITFRDFMELALYHPLHGYYSSRRDKIGREGDYLTSPEVSPIFGALFGRQLHEVWGAMGRPAAFDLVELGAGTGALCRDILAWAQRSAPPFFDTLAYRIVEVSEEMVEQQRRALRAVQGALDKVAWQRELDPGSVDGCLLSNEFFDSFPVHRVLARGGRLLEVYVSWDGGRFVEEPDEPSTPAIDEYFRRLGLRPGEGCSAEVNLQAPDWMRRAGRALRRGFVVTFDYGYEAVELYAPWRHDGTLMAFYRHSPGSDPYARVGRQDLTSHVDFTSLIAAGREAGLEVAGLVTQSEFLSNLGISDALRPPVEGGPSLEEYYARRRAVTDLIDPAGLGRIRVLVQTKSVGDCRLAGLGGKPYDGRDREQGA
ncbi:MAG: SAM-dependent methyltransferase [Chloroflexi bacterium]|nr:SAM-dependent methyltransferase [Chloroflexota bacterium]